MVFAGAQNVPSYNSVPWIGKMLRSIEQQTYTNYDVCVIDDASTDPRQSEIIQEYTKRNGWHFICNETNKKALHNVVHGTQMLCLNDEDVLIRIDGDDWLYNDAVLEYLDQVYSDPSTWMTYGQHIRLAHPRYIRQKRIPWWVHAARSYRKIPPPLVFFHPFTFKGFLWKAINHSDFLDCSGEYFSACTDRAMSIPMAEMAGRSHIRYISRVLYVYNDLNPINVPRVDPDIHSRLLEEISAFPKYPRLRERI